MLAPSVIPPAGAASRATAGAWPHQTVIVTDRRIQALGAAAVLRRPAGARVVSGRGKYLIPGLWDMHYHQLGAPDIEYPLLLANGVTGFREPGSLNVPLDSMRRWRAEVAAGWCMEPRQLVVMGHMLLPTLATPEDARQVIDSTKAAGAEMFKISASSSGLSREVYFALLAEARCVGLPVIGHLPAKISVGRPSTAGSARWSISSGSSSPLGRA